MRIALLVAAAGTFAPLTALAQAVAPAAQPPPPQVQQAPTPAPACNSDRDCPGALFCTGGQCVARTEAIGSGKDVSVQKLPMKDERVTQFGILLDAGIPDGFGLGLLFRPAYFIRLVGAGTFNGLGFGGRASVTLVPFNFFITPTVTAEAGRFFGGGNAGPIISQAFPGASFSNNPMLSNLSYDFVNVHLGLEVGSSQHFMFFLRAGGSYVQSTIEESGTLLQDAFGDPSLEVGNLTIRLTAPSLKLGVVAFF